MLRQRARSVDFPFQPITGKLSLRLAFAGMLVAVAGLLLGRGAIAAEPRPLALVVMDPLAGPLACDCVKGYAQRKYERLGQYLEKELAQPVKVYWGESLGKLATENDGLKADLIIGKHSVVLRDAETTRQPLVPIAHLTDQSGSPFQTGLLVVRKDDPAQGIDDLKDYQVIFGPDDCAEKFQAAKSLLEAHHLTPSSISTAGTCTIAASQLMKLPATTRAVGVISSYAEPLLAGCGTINKGDLRIVAKTEPVWFITAFVDEQVPAPRRQRLTELLLAMKDQPDLLTALETKQGFIPITQEEEASKKK